MRSGSSVPFVRRLELDRIDMREVVIDFGRQPTITKDTVPIEVCHIGMYDDNQSMNVGFGARWTLLFTFASWMRG